MTVGAGRPDPVVRWALTNGRGIEVFPRTDGELLDGIRRIEDAARRDGVRLVAILTCDVEPGPYLSVVLGDEESVLVFETGDHGRLGGFSVGPAQGDRTLFVAGYGTGDAYYERWMVIPRDSAVEAAREFFRTGTRPANVRWRDPSDAV